jgi:hypothetical protein
MTLTQDQKDMLRLINRSTDSGDGWRGPLREYMWELVESRSHPELMELDYENKRVRLTPDGLTVLRYLP